MVKALTSEAYQAGAKEAMTHMAKKMQKHSGLITSYHEDDKVYFELSDSILEKDLLMVTRFVQLPSNYQAYINAGSKTGGENVEKQQATIMHNI